jgi:transposase
MSESERTTTRRSKDLNRLTRPKQHTIMVLMTMGKFRLQTAHSDNVNYTATHNNCIMSNEETIRVHTNVAT